jgi:hypothetical protein
MGEDPELTTTTSIGVGRNQQGMWWLFLAPWATVCSVGCWNLELAGFAHSCTCLRLLLHTHTLVYAPCAPRRRQMAISFLLALDAMLSCIVNVHVFVVTSNDQHPLSYKGNSISMLLLVYCCCALWSLNKLKVICFSSEIAWWSPLTDTRF